jgi:hypothetical protein
LDIFLSRKSNFSCEQEFWLIQREYVASKQTPANSPLVQCAPHANSESKNAAPCLANDPPLFEIVPTQLKKAIFMLVNESPSITSFVLPEVV